MTYGLNRTSPVSRSASRLLQALAKVLPCLLQPVVLRWSVTQELDVTEQLDAGVRYLDLRIAHMPEGSPRNLHFVHMLYTALLVEDTLTEVSEWLERHPREVLVLACRGFEGLGPALHDYLVSCLQTIFGGMLCPRGEVPSLRQLWARGQQVVLSYEEEAAVGRHPELWPGIPYWWGDRAAPKKLVRFLERKKAQGRPDGLFVAGINLTADLPFVLAHPAASLRSLTLRGRAPLAAWVRAQRPGPRGTNVIAGDFVGPGSFVSDVIALNDKLLAG